MEPPAPTLPATAPGSARVRVRFRLRGIVQGVGFRPTVSRRATAAGLVGWVANDGADLVGEVEGASVEVDSLVAGLAADPPPLARIDHLWCEPVTPVGGADQGFTIAPSGPSAGASVGIPADRVTCAACLAEVLDPADRRVGHPFASCTDCGPRLSIALDPPFDRARTTMADLTLCTACRREHDDPADRRFHAQTICCPDCGPQLRAVPPPPEGTDLVGHAAACLDAGGVVVVKGLGGFHLMARADDEAAVARVRSLKRRPHEPVAVMVASLERAEALGHLLAPDREALASAGGPIVVVAARADARLASTVAPGTDQVGLLLPPTPLHHLLARATGGPLVLTSANLAGEPMRIDDAEVERRLAPDVDLLLTHDRRVATRVDDSLVRTLAGSSRPLRRARGWAPEPIPLAAPVPVPILGVGAAMKATVCLAVGDRAYLSTHLGDLAHPEAIDAHRQAAERLVEALAVDVEVVAHDLHPGYPSTSLALGWAGAEAIGVQHHHAHVAAVLAEHGRRGPVLGVAFDGVGWGPDGTVWGGEILLVGPEGSERVGHLDPVPMPGVEQAIRQPWRMACAHLERLGRREDRPDLAALHPDWDDVAALSRSGVRAPLASSAGRLFDAVAVLCGGPHLVTFEGQAAVGLEALARRGGGAAAGELPASVATQDGVEVISTGDLVTGVLDALAAGVAPEVVAARFHGGLVAASAEATGRIARARGIDTVVLAGGSFQNALLVEGLAGRLEDLGLEVLLARRVPTNDAGISLGQVAVAADVVSG